MDNFKLLFKEAYKVSKRRKLSRLATCGGVGSALITREGNIYTGTCIDAACSIGFCAEHSAISEMLKNGESEIRQIIAVTNGKKILPPCGRCRELILQVNHRNRNTSVFLSKTKRKRIDTLLPDPWSVS